MTKLNLNLMAFSAWTIVSCAQANLKSDGKPNPKPAVASGEQKPNEVLDSPSEGGTVQTGDGGSSGTTPPVVIDSGGGSSSGTVIPEFTLTVTVPEKAAKVTLTASGIAAQECSTTCSKKFKKDTAVTATVTSVTAPNTYTSFSFKDWTGGCAATNAAKSACDVTITGDKTIKPVIVMDTTYTPKLVLTEEAILRHSPVLYDAGVLTKVGLPNRCDHRDASGRCQDADYIQDSADARARVCTIMHPGSAVALAESALPTQSGWVAGYTNGYFNLKMSSWTGSAWNRFCHNGKQCFDAARAHISKLVCRLEY